MARITAEDKFAQRLYSSCSKYLGVEFVQTIGVKLKFYLYNLFNVGLSVGFLCSL